ncbi:MAG: SRPBCC family protein [Acidimicrobiales bacterium]
MADHHRGPRQLRRLPEEHRPGDPGRPARAEVLTPRALRAERTWRSTHAAPEVWDTVLDFAAYRSWWPWLIEFTPPRLASGAGTRAVVRAPAGYLLRLDLTLAEVDAPHRVDIVVAGDVEGRSTVTVRPREDGSDVALAWTLAPRRSLLRVLGVVARPVLVRGHDRILDDGLRRCLDATGLDLEPQSTTARIRGQDAG